MSSFQSNTLLDPDNGTLSRHVHRWILLSVIAIYLNGCATPTAPNSATRVGESPDYRVPIERQLKANNSPEQMLNLDAILWAKNIVSERGWLFALAELEALEPALISTETEQFIRSQLLWLKGDTETANALLNQILASDEDELDLLLAERQRRAVDKGDSITAAKLALDRLRLTRSKAGSITHSEVFNLLSMASESQIAAELRRTEPSSDWAAWLSLNRAYRKGRQEVLKWRASHPTMPSGLMDLPSGLSTWLNDDLPTRVAVLLPLSGRLKDVGSTILQGISEGFFVTYRDVDLRPQLITIDTEVTGSGSDAYLEALERGADFVIGPLTKERVTEIRALDNLPIPVLALNRGAADAGKELSSEQPLLSLSLAPEDEAIQLASLVWREGLRQPMVIVPDSVWGERMLAAFDSAWRTLGGELRAVTKLTSETNDNESIARDLATLQSESRINEVEKAFEAPVDSQARRRTDLDSVVLLTPTPQMARETRPLLRFHYAGKLPVFAPSTIYKAESSIANRDLNGLKFVLRPSALSTDPQRSQSLYALGLDAAALIEHFNQAEETRGTLLFGEIGDLSVDENGNVRRRLLPAVIARGKARPI